MRLISGTRYLVLPFLAAFALAGCDRNDELRDPEIVAQAGDFRFTADEAAEILAPEGDIPRDPQIVRALSDFWSDYVLLAWVVNREGELDRLDLDPIVRQQVEQQMVMRLRDQVIDTDPQVSDEELRAYFEEEAPGDEVRARHILLLFPDEPTEAQRDSVRTLAEELRDRARAGADFEAMAREYSEDPGSAARGGDLGFFGRDMMVPPFEQAAFGLEPGEVSEVVETQYGLHVIKSEERRRAEFDEIAESLREEMKAQQTMRAESIFIADLEGRAGMEVENGAIERVHEVTRAPEGSLSGRAARRALVRHADGAFRVEDYRRFLLGQDPGLREQILNASDEQIEDFLLQLARGKLLVDEARRQGMEVPSGEVEELEREIRREYRSAAEFLGLSGITPDEGESLRQAVERESRAFMQRLVTGEQELVPLQNLALPLRMRYRVRISEPGLERAVERMQEIRAERGIEEAGGLPLELQPPEEAPPDGEDDPDEGEEDPEEGG